MIRMFLVMALILTSFPAALFAADFPADQPRIAGNFQKALGEADDWSPSGSQLFLTDADGDGIYDISFTLDKGSDYQFKVIEGNDWSMPNHGNADGSNKTFTVEKNQSDVKISFNKSTKAIDVVVTGGTSEDDGQPKPNDIAWDELLHDSQQNLFRKPFGAIKAGEPVTLRIQTKADDVQTAVLSYWDEKAKNRQTAEMKKAGFATLGDNIKVDYWEATITIDKPTIIRYHFELKDGTKTVTYYDTQDGNGGLGAPSNGDGTEYQLTIHDPSFKTPDWMKNSVTYQIFADRFYNGKKANDTAVDNRGSRGAMPIEHKAWNDIPIDNPRPLETKYGRAVMDDRNNDGSPDYDGNRDGKPDFTFQDLDGDGVAQEVDINDNGTFEKFVDYKGDALWHNDFYGGDIAGVTQKLDYLQKLGITTIYLNPIFEASSAHKYDTSDYEQLDRMFGTNAEFQQFAKEAKKRGIHLILDGVFNHVGDDSRYFDRYGKYYNDLGYWQANGKDRNQNIGAYQAWRMKQKAAGKLDDPNVPAWDASVHFSPYEEWFTINEDGTYESWWGFDSLPVIKAPEGSELNLDSFADYIIRNDDSIARRWIEAGSSGWRLDVAPEVSHEFWQAFRDYTKGAQKGDLKTPNGEPIILTENWGDATVDLLGDTFDTTMNYRFRNALIDFILDEGFNDTDIMHNPIDAKGLDARLKEIQEDYPDEAFYAMMNLLGSHDTMRIQRVFGEMEPQFMSDEERSKVTDEQVKQADERAKKRLQLAAVLMMGYPGSPTIYYGDESGVTGWDDPDNRRPYDWNQEDKNLQAYFTQLANIRNQHQVLKTGTVETLYAEGHTYAYGRKIVNGVDALGNRSYKTEKGNDPFKDELAIVVASKEGGSIQVPVTGFVRNGAVFYDAQNPVRKYAVKNGTITVDVKALEGKILIADSKITPPVTVQGVTAASTKETGVSGEVKLTWKRTKDARSYVIYRSTIADGHYTKVGEVSTTSYTDKDVANGTRYYYAVTAVDKYGNESSKGDAAQALPYLPIDRVGEQTSSAQDGTHVIGTDKSVTVSAAVQVGEATQSTTALPYLQGKLTVTTAAGDKLVIPASFAQSKDGVHIYRASFTPDALGAWSFAMSFSTNQGEEWISVSADKVNVIADASDTTAPQAPELAQPGVESNRVELNWTTAVDADVVYYEIYRDDQLIARQTKAQGTRYVDTSVANKTEYSYKVAAVDSAFNRGYSNDVVITPDLVVVEVTFKVTAPDYTPKTNINIAGSFQSWNPSSADHLLTWNEAEQAFMATFEFQVGTKIEYKYARGDWSRVEKGSTGEEINNRVLTVVNQGGNKMLVENTVEKWADMLDR